MIKINKILAVFLSSVGIVGAVALAYHAAASHSWGGYHWARISNPFELKVENNLSAAWSSYLQTASNNWSLSSVLDTVVVPGLAKNSRSCKPSAGRDEVCNSKYGNTGWLGVASIWLNGEHITQGTVKLNDTYFNTKTYNTPAWKNLVVCQEVGHTLGLDHQDEDFANANLGTCMDYTNSPESNQFPNSHDYEELELIYSHLDTATTLSQNEAASAADEDSDDPRAWGKEIRRSQDGRLSVFEQDLGNGRKILRHVIWAEERKGKNI